MSAQGTRTVRLWSWQGTARVSAAALPFALSSGWREAGVFFRSLTSCCVRVRVDEEEIWGARAREILEAHDPATPLFYYYAFHLVHMDPINQMHVRKYLAQSMQQIASFLSVQFSFIKVHV